MRTPSEMNRSANAIQSILFAAALIPLPVAANAQSVEDIYRGKLVRVVVGSAAGGAYDSFARAMFRHMGQYLPGNPTFVVENMPGGGGLLSANYLYNIAPRDGLVIGMVERGSAIDPIINAKLGRSRFDSRKFNWIGSPTQELGLVIVHQPSPIKRFEDLKSHPLIVSSTSHTAPTSIYPRVLNHLFGTKFKVIEGYKSSREALMAVERGEAEGHVSGASSGVLRAQISPWIKDGKVSVIAQLGLTKDAAYPDATLVTELAATSEQREMLALMLAQQFMAYPLVTPPDVPADRVAALRNAFDATIQDAGFLDDTAHQGLQVRPARGVDIEAMLVKLYNTPPAVLERFAAMAGGT